MSISDMNKAGTSQLKKDYIFPKATVWYTEGVENTGLLLKSANRQAYIRNGRDLVLFSTKGGKKAALVLDFGTELVGGVSITTHLLEDGNKTASFKVRFGESVSEAMTSTPLKGATNDHAVRDFDIKLPFFGSAEVGQTGFRFVYIELTDPDTTCEIDSVQGIFTYRDIPYLGSFTCSDEKLNKIYDVSAYTVHLCMQQLLWDGVKRDRLVWFGDMHPEILAIRSVFGRNEVVDDSLRFLKECFPPPCYPNGMTTYAMWYVRSVWDWYLQNGDEDLVTELKPMWLALIKQLLGLIHGEGEVLREEEFERGFFFDWPTRDKSEASRSGVYALMITALEAGAELCRRFCEGETAENCVKGIKRLKEVRLSHGGMKQVAAMMKLAGTLSDSEAASFLTEKGGRGMSTFLSYYILNAVEGSAGMTAALSMLGEYYGGMLEAGATTFWEDFDLDWLKDGARIDRVLAEGEYDIHADNGKFCYVGLRHSLCHGWSAGPAAFLAEKVLGIEILEPGCKKVAVRPRLGGLSYAKGSYPTPFGIITVSVTPDSLEITAPEEIEIIKGVRPYA